MADDTVRLLRSLATGTDHIQSGHAIIFVAAADEIDRLSRSLESEIDARNKCMAALHGKDRAMDVLFGRLKKAGVDYSDLIP